MEQLEYIILWLKPGQLVKSFSINGMLPDGYKLDGLKHIDVARTFLKNAFKTGECDKQFTYNEAEEHIIETLEDMARNDSSARYGHPIRATSKFELVEEIKKLYTPTSEHDDKISQNIDLWSSVIADAYKAWKGPDLYILQSNEVNHWQCADWGDEYWSIVECTDWHYSDETGYRKNDSISNQFTTLYKTWKRFAKNEDTKKIFELFKLINEKHIIGDIDDFKEILESLIQDTYNYILQKNDIINTEDLKHIVNMFDKRRYLIKDKTINPHKSAEFFGMVKEIEYTLRNIYAIKDTFIERRFNFLFGNEK